MQCCFIDGKWQYSAGCQLTTERGTSRLSDLCLRQPSVANIIFKNITRMLLSDFIAPSVDVACLTLTPPPPFDVRWRRYDRHTVTFYTYLPSPTCLTAILSVSIALTLETTPHRDTPWRRKTPTVSPVTVSGRETTSSSGSVWLCYCVTVIFTVLPQPAHYTGLVTAGWRRRLVLESSVAFSGGDVWVTIVDVQCVNDGSEWLCSPTGQWVI